MESCGCGTLVCSAVKIMAAVLVLFLHFLTAPALESASDKDSPFKYPHLTSCVSTNMETFYCRWDVGTWQNLSKPEDLRLFYITKLPLHASSKEWSECPHYSIVRLNECFFSENHTSVWIDYSVQLRSRDQTILYDEKHFNVQDIVQPDPPLGLNWTMLNVSLTGSFYDIMLSWKPPPSADVNMGWMTLQYEVQYRKVHSEHWDTAELVKSTHRSVYGLQTNVNYEVQVRCKKHGEKKFGGFSDSIFVHVPSEASRFPLVALLIFGTLCLIVILMLVILSKQEKLMVILLPPVPGPKIRGIDPELLKKGKLKEFTSILGSPPELRPELYTNDPWVEFIDLDFEEQSDRLTNLDTDFLMDRSLFSNSSHLSIGFRDDDSGRASCCDPDLCSDPETSHFHSLVTNQIHHKEPAAAAAAAAGPGSASPSTTAGEPPSVVPVREALYTQDGKAEIQRLLGEMKAQTESHKRGLETVTQECRRQLAQAHKEGFSQLQAKEAEFMKLVEQKDLDLEELSRKLKDQERKQQSELLKLQVEFGEKLGRIQNTAQMSQYQQKNHDSVFTAQHFFKRKLQFFQEEKNKEIGALRQRIKELEDSQRTASLCSRSKKRRT